MLDNVSLEFGARRMPMLHQSEAAECGLACLAMIASHHGFQTDLPALRGRFNVSLKGLTLTRLEECAERLRFVTRALRLEVDELRELKTPCMLHWQMNHFVVLSRVDAQGIVIHDPAVGVRRLGFDEVDKQFTGIALELTPAVNFEPVDERRRVSVAALLGKVSGLWKGLVLVLVMALALEAIALAAPMLNQWVVDEALVSGDRGLLNMLALATLLLLVTQTAIEQARGWTVMYLSTHLKLQWVSNVFSHLLRLPLAWFEKRHLGDVISRFGAVHAIQQTLTTGFVSAILDGLMAMVTMVVMFVYSASLAFVVLASVVLYAMLRAAAYRPLREASVEGLALAAKEQSCFLETIRAIQAIRLFGRELDRRSRWLNLLADSINRTIRTQKLGLWFGNAHTAVAGVASVLVLWIGGGMVLDGRMTLGMMFAFTSYSGQFGARMAALVDRFVDFKMLSLHAERLADIVLEAPEPETTHDGGIDNLVPRIELVDVGFRYSDGEPWVLRHVNLVIEPGEALAIVGPSGGGKSTLVKLILGILAPAEGEIRYGGVPIQKLGARTYRAALGTVMQDDQLLAGSLRDNISFFDQPGDPQRVEQCARLAAMHTDIEAMPMGYETLTGDMGTALSGGQKQRILLARALYKGPKVLVLDEATSHLDVMLERAVNAAVASLNVSRIIVAHRPETIASARRVVVLADGGVAHDALVSRTVQPAFGDAT